MTEGYWVIIDSGLLPVGVTRSRKVAEEWRDLDGGTKYEIFHFRENLPSPKGEE